MCMMDSLWFLLIMNNNKYYATGTRDTDMRLISEVQRIICRVKGLGLVWLIVLFFLL